MPMRTHSLVRSFVPMFLALVVATGVAYADEPPPQPTAPAAGAAAPPPAPAAAPAGANPLAGVNLDAYQPNPETGNIPLVAGRKFLADLKGTSPEVWASVVEAARFDIQMDETMKFAHQKQFVIYAYAAIWVILIVFVVGLYARQRKLAAELAELERKVGVERK